MLGLDRIDVRLLGWVRLWLGLVLLGDLLRRLPYLSFFYSEDGMLPSHGHLFAPLFSPGFSLLHPFNTRAEVTVAFTLIGVIYIAYLVGYCTRLAQVLSLLAYTSLNNRNIFLENTGAMTLGLVLTWTLLLPMGRAWSVDAAFGRGGGPLVHRSLAVTAIPLQIAVCYFFNAIQKNGITWRNGEAVHWVLWQNRIATGLAAWLRLHEPSWLSPALSWATLGIEAAAPALVLWPGRSWKPRAVHVALTTGLHGSIALLFHLGVFPFVMLGLNALVLPRPLVERLDRRLRALVGSRFAGPDHEQDARQHWPEPWAPWLTMREALAAFLLLAAAWSALRGNWIIPPRFRPPPVAILDLPVAYLRGHQTWSLFAPEAPREDGTVVVEATTASGRRIDPFTGKEPDLDPPGPWGYGQLWCDFFFHLRRPELSPYYRHLDRYLLRWHQLTGRPPEDRIVSYRIWWLTYRSPPPGSTQPTLLDRRILMER
ncbi:MAG: HTTM domain-containing protein [Myxococcales bacterium]|nr:HTTM domain-containing protein [Polyangiaceae bacterium]MDW8250813.1 HTTM domain-containing protein [Myxococcales bacterium]